MDVDVVSDSNLSGKFFGCLCLVFSLIFFVISFYVVNYLDILYSFSITIFFIFLSVVFLFVGMYNFSLSFFDYRKRIALGIGVIYLLVIFMLRFLGWYMYSSMLYVFIFLLLIAVLLFSHFVLWIKKVKYSFIGLLPVLLLHFIFKLILELKSSSSFLSNISNIWLTLGTIVSFFTFIFPVSFIILLVLNLVLNRKETENSRKKWIMLFWVPLLLGVILFFLNFGFGVLFR